MSRRERARGDWVGVALLILFSPLILAVAAAWIIGAVGLHLLTLIMWLPAGRRVLFVYSGSPVWQAHIETEVLPRLPPTAAILNWSERSQWSRWSLAVWLFRFYGGGEEYNPLGMVIRPLSGPKVFHFWRAFRDAKHGKPEPLRAVEGSFFEAIGPR